MRLATMRLKGFRCYSDEIQLDFDQLTAIIGRNDAGKSTILDALDIFFGNAKVEPSDGSVHSNDSLLEITCEFDRLPDQIIIDETNRTTLAAEHLLNANERLEWTVAYKTSLKTPSTKPAEEYLTALHPSSDRFSDLLFLKNNELKLRLDELGVSSDEVDKRKNAEMRAAIWAAAEDLQVTSQKLPIAQIDGGSGKEISDKLKQQRPMYFLFQADRPGTDQDSEAQDPLKKAVQAAMGAQDELLAEIARYVEQEVAQVASATLTKLRDIDPFLAEDLRPLLEQPKWQNAFKVRLEDDAGISLNKRGSGIRRLVLLSFLQAQAEKLQRDENRAAIYAIEEPETSLHPDLQQQLFEALALLSQAPSTQVLLTTHTPTLGSLLPIDGIRYLETARGHRRIIHSGSEEALERAASALGVHRVDTVRLLLGVEGPNDMQFFRNISRVLAQAGEDIPDIEVLENDSRLIMFPFGGSSLKYWVHKLGALKLPELHITDRDHRPPQMAHYQEHVDRVNARHSCEAYITSKREIENYIHPDAIQAALGVRVEVDDWSSVPKAVASAKGYNPKTAKRRLNDNCVRRMTPELLDERDPDDDIRNWLRRVGELVAL